MTILISVMIYIFVILSLALTRFYTTDPLPELKAINTEVLKKLGPFAVRVNTGMFIKNFPVFDIDKNNFLIDSVIWFEFNTDEIVIDTIEKFSIDKGKIISKSPPDVKMKGDKVFVKYNVLFDLKTDLNFRRFPFEDHRIPIVLSNDFVTPDEMYYAVEVSSFQMLPNISPSGWKIQDKSVDAGYLVLNFDQQNLKMKTDNPKALFIIKFVKASLRKAFIIFIPIYFAAFLALLSFLLNISNIIGIASLTTTALTAILGYRFVIESMMPQVGYFTITDNTYLFLLFYIFIIFIIQLLIVRSYLTVSEEKNVNKHVPFATLHNISSIIFITISLLLVIVTTYIILS